MLNSEQNVQVCDATKMIVVMELGKKHTTFWWEVQPAYTFSTTML